MSTLFVIIGANNDDFAMMGSGQTWGKLPPTRRFYRRLCTAIGLGSLMEGKMTVRQHHVFGLFFFRQQHHSDTVTDIDCVW